MIRKVHNKIKKQGKPPIYFLLASISALALLLPNRIVLMLSSSSMDFPQHHYLIGAIRLITYQFMHGGLDHFKYNFLFALAPCLYLEKRLGKLKFLSFYLFAGVVSALVFNLAMSHSAVGEFFTKLGVPFTLLGASGSIYGCMTLAAVLWGAENMYHAILSCLFAVTFIAFQVANAIESLRMPMEVAYWGHVGGVLAAVLVLPLFIKRKK